MSDNEPQNEAQNEAQKIEKILIDLIRNNPKITRKEMCLVIKKSKSTLERVLRKSKNIYYEGSSKNGHWIIKK